MKIRRTIFAIMIMALAAPFIFAEINLEKIKSLQKKAEKGDVEAQYQLGKLYYDEDSGIKDPTEAVKYFKMAADKGYAPAINALGDCYYDGEGFPQSYEEAVKYYKIAVEKGDAEILCLQSFSTD